MRFFPTTSTHLMTFNSFYSSFTTFPFFLRFPIFFFFLFLSFPFSFTMSCGIGSASGILIVSFKKERLLFFFIPVTGRIRKYLPTTVR